MEGNLYCLRFQNNRTSPLTSFIFFFMKRGIVNFNFDKTKSKIIFTSRYKRRVNRGKLWERSFYFDDKTINSKGISTYIYIYVCRYIYENPCLIAANKQTLAHPRLVTHASFREVIQNETAIP